MSARSLDMTLAETRAAYTVDGRSVARDAFYAAACDPSRSVVVEACAGAGKTWMLVSRILRALLAGAQPNEILAIVGRFSQVLLLAVLARAVLTMRRLVRLRRRSANCTKAFCAVDVRSRYGPSMHGSRSCCAPHRWSCSPSSDCSPTWS